MKKNISPAQIPKYVVSMMRAMQGNQVLKQKKSVKIQFFDRIYSRSVLTIKIRKKYQDSLNSFAVGAENSSKLSPFKRRLAEAKKNTPSRHVWDLQGSGPAVVELEPWYGI
jgi:hypothetical protein